MKRIPLTKGKEALVDDQDYDYLMRWKWHIAAGSKYAARDAQRQKIYMHIVVVRRAGRAGKRIDHMNQNTLDNRRNNLRVATHRLNLLNRGPQANNVSGYKGVMWYSARQQWRAQIGVFGRRIHLGYFAGTEAGRIEAARAYNDAALKHFGEFAHLNPV